MSAFGTVFVAAGDGELAWEITVEAIGRGCPANLSGHPDGRHPGDPAETAIVEAFLPGDKRNHLARLSARYRQRLEAAAEPLHMEAAQNALEDPAYA